MFVGKLVGKIEANSCVLLVVRVGKILIMLTFIAVERVLSFI